MSLRAGRGDVAFPRRSALKFVVLLTMLAAAVGLFSSPVASAWRSTSVSVKVSSSPDRSSARTLAGATVSGQVAVFAAPSSSVTRVRFWLDDPYRRSTPRTVEYQAPWDFAGTAADGRAYTFDTTTVPSGTHTITAEVRYSTGRTATTTHSFKVTQPTQRELSPTTTSAPVSTTAPVTTLAATTTSRATSTTSAPTTAPPTTSAPTTAPATTVAPTTSVAPSGSWPSAANTGVPAGVTLTPSGGMTITTPGTVIDGKDISGTINVHANNVTIRNSRVRGSGFALVWIAGGVTGTRIEDCDLDGMKSSAGSMGVWGPATVLRNDIVGVENAVAPGSGSVVQDNYIHALGAPGSPHIDGIQIDGGLSNITIRHNTIDMTEWSQTATVMIDNYFGPISNMSVDNNLLKGAGFTVYSDGQFSGGSITGVKFTNNAFVRGYWGYALIRNNSVTQSGNYDYSSGKAITL